jgi:thioredoxin reductase
MKQLAIIGGGPAGISASIYAVRKKMDFVLITKEVWVSMRREIAPTHLQSRSLPPQGKGQRLYSLYTTTLPTA